MDSNSNRYTPQIGTPLNDKDFDGNYDPIDDSSERHLPFRIELYYWFIHWIARILYKLDTWSFWLLEKTTPHHYIIAAIGIISYAIKHGIESFMLNNEHVSEQLQKIVMYSRWKIPAVIGWYLVYGSFVYGILERFLYG